MYRVKRTYIILLLGSLVFAYVEGGNLPYTIFYILTLIFIISIIYTNKIIKNMFCNISFSRNVFFTGEDDVCKIIVRNNSIFPILYLNIENKCLKIVNKKYVGDVVYVNPSDVVWINKKILFTRRGVYNFGEFNINFKDIFNIFTVNRKIHRELQIKVYPRIHQIENIDFNSGDEYINLTYKKSGREEMSSISDIKKYLPGESLKKVHWKLSAKFGELYIKNFDHVAGEQCNIFIDMNKNNLYYDINSIAEETMVEFLVSVCNYFLSNRINTKVFINAFDQTIINVNSLESFNALQEHMLTQKSDSEIDFQSFLTSNISKVKFLSWLVMVTIEVNKDFTSEIIALKDRGHKVTVFYCENVTTKDEYIKKLKSFGVECFSYSEIYKKVNN